MNKEQFFNYLNNPEQLDKSSIEDLSQLVNDYPYFQTVHLLYIKNLSNLKDIKFDNQLKKASLYSSDRKSLYSILNKPSSTKDKSLINNIENTSLNNIIPNGNIEIITSPDNKIEETIDIEIELNKPEIVQEDQPQIVEINTDKIINIDDTIIIDITQEEKPITLSDNIITEEKAIESEINVNESTVVNDIKDNYIESINVDKKERIADVVLRQIEERNKLRNNRIQSIQFEKSPKQEEKIEELVATEFKPDVSEEIEQDFTLQTNIEEPQNIIDNTDIDTNLEILDNNTNTTLSVDNFDELSRLIQVPYIITDSDMSNLNNDIQSEEIPNDIIQNYEYNNNQIENNLETNQIDLLSFSEWLEIYGKRKSFNSKPIKQNVKKQFDLIDSFIKEDPKIKPPKTHKEGDNTNIKHNIEENEELITETLAGIYVKQGYYYKAINVLNKLSLKYPEKSIYFATQIEEINLTINNKT